MQEKMKLYSVEMTETELRLFSEFLGQKEFAGPVKMQNKALKRQNLMKRHNISNHASSVADIRGAREKERSIPRYRQRYHYGQRDQNRENLHINITNGGGTWDPGQVRDYKGEKHIATRSKLGEWFDKTEPGLRSYDYEDPSIMGMIRGKHIKVKGPCRLCGWYR